MNHENEEMLTALLDGQLTAEQETELRARIEREAGLREMWEQLQAQRVLLRGLPSVKAPDDFLSKIAVAMQERAGEVTLPPSEIEAWGPRGGWRSVIALASALAALLLLGVFLWPRNAAQNSDQVASFDGNDRARQQEVEELKRLEKGDWVESAPVQRAPSGPLPKATELAEGNALMPGAAADAEEAAGAADAAKPRVGLGANLKAQAAPADELADAPAGNATQRSARRDGEAVDSAGKQAAEIAGIPQKMSEFKGGDPPSLAAGIPSAGIQGGFGAAAGQVGPVEVWVVDRSAASEPTAGEDKQLDVSLVEVYFASIAEMELPSWMNELRSAAEITRLDIDESRELITQLAQQDQRREKSALEKPAGVEAADLEGASGLRVEAAGGAAANKSEESAPQVGYLGLQQAAPLDALMTRSQQRQLASQKSIAPELGSGGSESGGGVAGGAGAKDEGKSSLESNLSNLRTRSAESRPLPQALPPGGGRNVLIIIRSR